MKKYILPILIGVAVFLTIGTHWNKKPIVDQAAVQAAFQDGQISGADLFRDNMVKQMNGPPDAPLMPKAQD